MEKPQDMAVLSPVLPQLIVYCPNCANALEALDKDSCSFCGAYFGPGSTLKPLANQPFTPHKAHIDPQLTKGEKYFKGIVAVPLLLVGLIFLTLSFYVGWLGFSFVALPFLISGIFVVTTRGSAAKIVSILAGLFLLFLLLLVLQIIAR